MSGNTRNVVLFVALSTAALLTWVFARVTEEPDAPAADPGPSPQNFYMLGATMQGFDDEGRIYYEVKAERVEQAGEDEPFVLEQMSVEYAPETQIRWDISAARGVADANRESWHLQNGVRLVYAADAEQDRMTFEAEDLLLNAREFFASTTEMITMRRGASVVTALGLELNLETDDWVLGSDDTTRSDVTLRTSN